MFVCFPVKKSEKNRKVEKALALHLM